ncbi:FAD-binding oxidoreductase [Pseudomonas sp. P5_152]|uniref:FAD-binding oxidoreductase n=1 Tax=Pseudomonas sp. P5_152 TaxID=3043442 RepID=UPI002A366B76|nr:FAD-binding oxidoreductase [Pseudomonas sp. P5_152]MDX9667996.1 FAD-binding oxidoreductase [Pseudomonas sp. P5_152]
MSGPRFLLVILHWLSFKSPITLSSPSGIWLILTCGFGVAAAVYKTALYPFVARAEYIVTAVNREKDALHLTLAPVHNGFSFKAGHFAFLAIRQKGLREPHPLTISSAHAVNWQIEFLIRALGDYTQRLRDQVKIGMHADIYAPYGRFKRQPQAEREIWIGAGVGISPFISWLQDTNAQDFDKVTLIYFFNPSRAFPSAGKLRAMAEMRNVRFVGNVGDIGHLAETLREAVTWTEPQQIQISFCGPNGLLIQVRELMRDNLIPQANLHIELFELR